MAVVPRITLAVGPWTGSAPTAPVTSFTSATVKDNLVSGPEIAFTAKADSPAALVTDGLTTDVWCYKKGTLFQRGRVLPIAQSWGADGQDDAAITAVGYRRVVEARFIVSGPPRYSQTDQGAILWDLISRTQALTNGSLGITAGSYTTGQVRDRMEYKIGDSYGTIMGALGDVVNGCWWGIDPALVFNAKLWSAFTTHAQPIVRGVNANAMSRTPGPRFANYAGASGSDGVTTPEWRPDAGLAADTRGRWEVFDASHSDVTVQATVGEYAAGLLADRSHPPAAWTIDLDPDDYFEGSSNYTTGQFARLVVPKSAVDPVGPPPIDVGVQITEVSIQFTEDGGTTVTLAAVETA